MNFGKVENCPHLQAMLTLLRNRGSAGATTAELQAVSNSMATSTDVSAIRHQGYDIVSKLDGRSAAGRKIYRYWLKEPVATQGDLFVGERR